MDAGLERRPPPVGASEQHGYIFRPGRHDHRLCAPDARSEHAGAPGFPPLRSVAALDLGCRVGSGRRSSDRGDVGDVQLSVRMSARSTGEAAARIGDRRSLCDEDLVPAHVGANRLGCIRGEAGDIGIFRCLASAAPRAGDLVGSAGYDRCHYLSIERKVQLRIGEVRGRPGRPRATNREPPVDTREAIPRYRSRPIRQQGLRGDGDS